MTDSTKPETMVGSASQLPRLPHLADSILQFNLTDEIARLRQADSWQRGTGRSSKTLVKHPDFRIVLTLIRANSRVSEHRTEARVSIQTIMGRVRIHLSGRTVELGAGEILALDSAVPHDVEAIEESAFLLTVGSLHPSQK